HWIMVNVIHRCPEMPLGAHETFGAVEPDFPPSLFIFSIPVEGCLSMHPANVLHDLEDGVGFNQRMIVIGKNAPRYDTVSIFFECLQQLAFKCRHSLQVFADDWQVLIASRGKEIMSFFALPVRETVPGESLMHPKLHQFAPLLF